MLRCPEKDFKSVVFMHMLECQDEGFIPTLAAEAGEAQGVLQVALGSGSAWICLPCASSSGSLILPRERCGVKARWDLGYRKQLFSTSSLVSVGFAVLVLEWGLWKKCW